MELINVIKEPYTPGKRFGSKDQNVFVLAFLVEQNSNKIMIQKAFKAMFGVKVKSVNTLIRKPHRTRVTKYSRENFTKSKKIAYISLTREDFMNLKREIEGEAALEEELLKNEKRVSIEEKPEEFKSAKKENISNDSSIEEKKSEDVTS